MPTQARNKIVAALTAQSVQNAVSILCEALGLDEGTVFQTNNIPSQNLWERTPTEARAVYIAKILENETYGACDPADDAS